MSPTYQKSNLHRKCGRSALTAARHPFTDEEMEKILWAADTIREVHPQVPPATVKKLKALILLMRYSGIRISDAVMFRRGSLKDGKLFLRQEKTKRPVLV